MSQNQTHVYVGKHGFENENFIYVAKSYVCRAAIKLLRRDVSMGLPYLYRVAVCLSREFINVSIWHQGILMVAERKL